MNKHERTLRASRRAFSMVEILVAILILGLGMLGLAAVFPVVITQQRDAIDTVRGESAASTARAIVESMPEIIEFPAQWFNPDPSVGSNEFGKEESGDDFFTHEWIVAPNEPYASYPILPGFVGGFSGSQDGFWFRDLKDLNVPPTVFEDFGKGLAVADRLIPAPYSGQDPEFVWDIVMRREPNTNRPQVALFVRRVDARIEVPDGVSLSDVLVGGVGAADPVLPVALDRTTGQRVVDDGQNNNHVYAAPQTLDVQVFTDRPDLLVFENADDDAIDASISQAVRPGQLLIDNTGTVRTVLGPATDPAALGLRPEALAVRVEPPFLPTNGAEELEDGTNFNPDDNAPDSDVVDAENNAARASWVRQVIFTPRTPVAVRVFTLEAPS